MPVFPGKNVVHEIGLFQGRLGFQKAIIVKEKRAGRFSNIDGLTYIPYSKGKIADAFAGIERALVRERVIPPATLVTLTAVIIGEFAVPVLVGPVYAAVVNAATPVGRADKIFPTCLHRPASLLSDG